MDTAVDSHDITTEIAWLLDSTHPPVNIVSEDGLVMIGQHMVAYITKL